MTVTLTADLLSHFIFLYLSICEGGEMASPADREDRTFFIYFNRISRTIVN